MEVPTVVDVKADGKGASQSGAEGEMSWQNQLRHVCAVMLVYAFASGLNVSESVSQAIAEAEIQLPVDAVKLPQTLGNDRDTGSGGAGSTNAPQNGLDNRIRLLTAAHNHLVAIVAPAIPRTIQYIKTSAKQAGYWGFLGKVPFAQRCMVMAILFLLGFILIRVSPYVHILAPEGTLDSSGLPLLLHELFYFTAAGLGASFAVLFEVNQSILNATFDPFHEPFYWARFALGLIAGVMLAELVPEDLGKPMAHKVAKPILALLGGFSASIVYRVLVYLCNTIVALVPGGANDESEGRGGPTRQTGSAESASADRLAVVSHLISLQQRVGPEMSAAQLKEEIGRVVTTITMQRADAK
jgi:hypothetical protein